MQWEMGTQHRCVFYTIHSVDLKYIYIFAGQSQLNPTVDISVAVATPNGLITPIVNTADLLGLSAINNKVVSLTKMPYILLACNAHSEIYMILSNMLCDNCEWWLCSCR